MAYWTWYHKRSLQAIWDLGAWLVAMPLAVALRYEFHVPDGMLRDSVVIGLLFGIVFLALGAIFHLHRGRYVVGSFDEVLGVVATTLAVGGVATIGVILIASPNIPRSTPVIGTGIACTFMLGARFAWRNTRQQSALSKAGRRTLIYGAGDAGQQIANLMLADRTNESQPIGFIDDDPTKQHLRRAGLKVLGSSSELEELIISQAVETVLVAIAGITAERLLEIDRRCKPLGVTVRVIPTASEIIGGAVRLGDISDVTEEDLLGRRAIQTDESGITDFIHGRRILVTGAGGSIGSELARQLARYSPAKLALLDRDESALHSTQISLDGSGTLTSDSLILADIRDTDRMRTLFQDLRPDIVFHAAALKHLPLLERYPSEAYKTNVLGSLNVLQAAQAAGVRAFVNISTDKAAEPSSMLGFSKLVTERLTANMSGEDTAKFVSVRFGNVLGSRGSVIHTFRYQIANGGPVTVTDERVTRYFMTVGEAVHLVLQAAVIGQHGETLILDMGTAVKIADVARYMIQRSGRDINIVYTGLRTGEKLDEILVAPDEAVQRPVHPLISHARVKALDASQIDRSLQSDEESERELRRLAQASTAVSTK